MIFSESLQGALLLLLRPETWTIMLVPTAMLGAIALVRRTWTWGYTTAFSIGYLALSITIGYWHVYILGHVDEKFRHGTFEENLTGAGVFSTLYALVFLIGLGLGRRIRPVRSPSWRWPVSLAFGAATPLGAGGLYLLFGKTGAYGAIAWGWMFMFPLGCAFLLIGPRRGEGNGGTARTASFFWTGLRHSSRGRGKDPG